MSRGSPDSPLREFADGISQETERVATIVSNLLTFARQERESHSPANIADIVSGTVSLIGTIIQRDQISLEVDVPDDLPQHCGGHARADLPLPARRRDHIRKRALL
jgi:signal transduction histidine kinase